jgi:hypothetical protein
MANNIDRTSEVNSIANGIINDTGFISGSTKKHSEVVEALETGIKTFGSSVGKFIPGAEAFCAVASAVLGFVAGLLGT